MQCHRKNSDKINKTKTVKKSNIQHPASKTQYPAPNAQYPDVDLNGPFWGQKGAFKPENRPVFEVIMCDNKWLLRSDPDSMIAAAIIEKLTDMAVVLQDVPPYAVVAGNPARVIRMVSARKSI